MKIINLFLKGIYDSIYIWKTFSNLSNSTNKDILTIYGKIIFYNSICIIINIFIYQILIPFCWFPDIIFFVILLTSNIAKEVFLE